jgi:cellulose biosynthesis protein BcsQ
VEVQPNLQSLRATPACLADAGWEALGRIAARHDIDTLVIDAPTLSRPLQSRVLMRCHLAVLAVPADAASLKTLLPFCEYMAEEKNRPNRVFEVAAVLTRVQCNSPQREAVIDAARTYLAPILVPDLLAENAVYTAAMAQGFVPYGPALPLPEREALATLANHLLGRVPEGEPTLANH